MDEQRGRSSTRNEPARARRGVVLVFVALFVWIVMGIAALVIDQGAARLTQRQLHSATDGVALESMRDRDQARNLDEVDDFLRDRRRRVRANRMSFWHFFPELATGANVPDDEFRGGGAYIDVDTGFGNMDAGAQVLAAGFGVPRLAANYHFDGENAVPLNRRWGDVVSGAFLGLAQLGGAHGETMPQGLVGTDGNPFHVEDAQYHRTDFVPADPEQAPYATSVVVRLRRTQVRSEEDSNGGGPVGDEDFEDQGDVSTAGDTLPYLFGRGTTMAANAEGGDGYSPRRDGQTIRATTIGSSRPVVRVSPPLPHMDMDPDFTDGFNVGCAPFVIFDLLWHWKEGEVWTTEDGGRTWVMFLTYENGFLWNSDWDSIPAGLLRPPRLTRVGDKILDLGSADELWANEKNWEVEEAYAPVYRRHWAPGVGFSRRAIGFVRVSAELELIPNPDGPGEVRAMKVTKLGNDHAPDPELPWIAPRNASAVFDGEQVSYLELQSEAGGPEAGWNWASMIQHLNRLERAVHAPVIVR